jgi:hypothetical protein
VLFLRAGVERLLLLLLWIARIVFLLQALAVVTATAATFAAAGGTAPAWLQGAMAKGLLISGIFLVAGVLLVVARRWRVPSTGVRVEPTWPWPLVLGLSLLVMPAVAAMAGSGLPSLWRRIAAQLSAVGFWDGGARPDPYGGIVLLPIMLALMVPTLLTAATAFSIGFPLALLPLLSGRRRLFPTLLAMGVVCQVALVLTGWIAADVFAGLATETLTAMGNSGDAEVQRLGEELAWATGIMRHTALALAAPALGMLAWLVFLRPSGEAATHFATDVPADSAPMHDARVAHAPSSATPHTWMPAAPLAAPPAAARASNPRPRPGIVSQAARVGLFALGTLLLLFGAADGLRARASYVDSRPAAGATLATSPRAVRVTLAARLNPGSSLSIIRLAGKPGEFPQDVKIDSRLAPDDPDRRTIEGVPTRALSTGLYRVAWWARPTGGGGAQQGTFSFGVAVAVPSDTPDDVHTVSERDAGARKRRQILFGGVLLLALAVLLPWLVPRL